MPPVNPSQFPIMRIIFATIFFVLMGSALAADFDPARFEKEVIVPACNDPMQLEVLADGRVFFIERNGSLKLVEPHSKRVVLLGQALDRDFAKSQALFLFVKGRGRCGRSFGTTLGHPWSNWQDTNFRRLVVQGIRWSLK